MNVFNIADMLNYMYANAEYLLAGLHIAMSVAVTIHATLLKRDSKAVIAWIGVAWLSPIIGSLAYYLFGINRIQRRAVQLAVKKAWSPVSKLELTSEEALQKEFFRNNERADSMIQLSRELSGRYLLPGNDIKPLIDGDEAYPAMLAAIRSASKSVSLVSYIFDNDPSGLAFVEALANAHNRGVEVRILVDGVGSNYSRPSIIKPLRDAGIPTAVFLPTRVPRLPKTANLRNHRKILVIDGEVGFTGGTNIRQGHCLQQSPTNPTRCLHFQIAGPVIKHLQQTFAVDWAFVTKEQLEGERWFPTRERHGEIWARGISHGPDEDFEKISDLLVGALSLARDSVQIVTPYFLPPATLMQVLGVTAMRGVRVDIFIPAENNVRLVQWATMGELWQLLDKGCNVYLVPPPFDHTKLMIVDDLWSLIGSTNWDPRSLRLNFEFNVECYSRELAQQLQALIDEKRKSARKLHISDLTNRSNATKLRDGGARLFGPYL
jgi:cardiolipin synthase A/B